MNNNNLLIYGAVAVGAIFLYSRYTKKPTTPQEEPQGGGGGGGGGFAPIGPIFPMPIVPNVVIQNIPRPVNQGRSYTADEATKSKNTTPTPPPTPTQQKNIDTGVVGGFGTSTGGIVPVSQGGSTTPQYSTGTVTQSQMSTGLSGGAVFKPFDGDNGRLRLENLVRSFNRP